MNENSQIFDFKEEDKPMAFMDILSKYLRFWYWFLICGALFLALGYFYEKHAPKTYDSVAKVKVLNHDKEAKIIPNEAAIASQNMRLNLENHVEVLKSYLLLNNVVRELELDVEYHKLNEFFYSQIFKAPFKVTKNVDEDAFQIPLEFEITLSTSGFNITDKLGKSYIMPYDKTNSGAGDILPFSLNLVEIANISDYKQSKYKIVIRKEKQATLLLAEELNIKTSEKQSDILSLSLKGQSKELSEAVLNSIVRYFDEDGVVDRQLVAKRTLEVIDKRFIFLAQELDSIETDKQNFKVAENLSNIDADVGLSIQAKSGVKEKINELTSQISLSKLLKKTVSEEVAFGLLPGNIGLDNQGLNTLVSKYNEMVRERQRLIVTVGANHPRLITLSEQLELGKLNILSSVNVYESQLNVKRKRLDEEKEKAGFSFSKLPMKERLLRSIERQQSIKENLYLLLLKKREEAAIEYAATRPTVKVIDFGLTGIKPIWPKKIIVYPVCFLIGMLIPFGLIFMRSSLDTKVHDRFDIERVNPEIPVLIEIPFFDKEKSFAKVNDRSALAESFRILSTNTDYLLSDKDSSEAKIIYMTSSVKGEGKTLLAMNLSLAYASMGKKVLLVGADLRNPQLHTYFNLDKGVKGLSDYLSTPNTTLDEILIDTHTDNPNHKLCLSGGIPQNAPVLLLSKRFEDFVENAKRDFDYVIIDTAPTMLVTDTMLISKYADITLFTVCSGYTDKKLLQFSKDLNRTKKLKNMAYVLNAVGVTSGASSNYGYGYGYDSNTVTKSKSKMKRR